MPKHILVTAGATVVPIDKVRAITNIFKGRTGTNIALHFANRGYEVTLLTSNPSLLDNTDHPLIDLQTYRTFDELLEKMKVKITTTKPDVVIHSAAVSDYSVDGVCVVSKDGDLVDIDSSKKVSSDAGCLFLRLIQTSKIVDLIRKPWGFKGYLVKFKLQVGMTDEELLAIAKKSRIHSKADMIVANCLEWSRDYAYICTCNQTTRRNREDLPEEIEERIRKDMLWESE